MNGYERSMSLCDEYLERLKARNDSSKVITEYRDDLKRQYETLENARIFKIGWEVAIDIGDSENIKEQEENFIESIAVMYGGKNPRFDRINKTITFEKDFEDITF